MEDAERREHAEMLAGDIKNALDDLECLWACYGLPGVSQRVYRKASADCVAMRSIAPHMATADLMVLLRTLADTVYERFGMNPETRREGDDKERV